MKTKLVSRSMVIAGGYLLATWCHSVEAQVMRNNICWGQGSIAVWGIKGTGGNPNLINPAKIPKFSDVVKISGGYQHYLCMTSMRTGAAWGSGGKVVSGRNVDDGRANWPAGVSSGVTDISAGYDDSLLTRGSGDLASWGANDYGQTTPPPNLGLSQNVLAVAAGRTHGLAITKSGKVVAWGSNNTTNEASLVPARVTGATAIAAGDNLSMALLTNGTVVVWGGDAGTGITNVPPACTNIVAISAGSRHCLALNEDGRVFAWGANDKGQINVPSKAATNIVAIACGWKHSLAVTLDYNIVGWGDNSKGQLDVPTTSTWFGGSIAGSTWGIAATCETSAAICGGNPPLPDFYVDSIALSTQVLHYKEPFTATITVGNIGTWAGSAGELHFWINWQDAQGASAGRPADYVVNIGFLMPGKKKTIVLPNLVYEYLRVDLGITCRAVIDARNRTAESNERNNDKAVNLPMSP